MHPSQDSGPSSSKRKSDGISASNPSSNSRSESHVITSPSTNFSSWNFSQEGREIIRNWTQIENTWVEKAKSWSQHEFDWYRRMNDHYQRWSIDENSDKSVHPNELVWAFLKLDQATREVMHCREWIAYAKWQVSSRTGRGMGACPPLPSLDGRVPVGNNGRLLSPVRERDDKNDDDGRNEGDNPNKDERRSAALGPAQHPAQALAQDQAPMKDSTQSTAQDPHEASEKFVALVKSTSQSSTAVQTHFKTFAKASQAPMQSFTQNTSRGINGNVSEEFSTVLQLQGTSRNHISFQTPVHAGFRASVQASGQVVTQDSVNTSLQSRNPPPVQTPSVPTQQARVQSSTSIFQVAETPIQVQAPVQTPGQALIQHPQTFQPGYPKISWSPQVQALSQQQSCGQAPRPMPLLTFAEFIATGSQQLTGESVRQPAAIEQPGQQLTRRSTQKPTQRPNQYRIQRPAPPKASPKASPKSHPKASPKAISPKTNPKVPQSVTAEQVTQKTTQSPTQQPTQPIYRPNQRPTTQFIRHDPIAESHNYHNNTTDHGKALLDHNISGFGETCGNAPPHSNKPNYATLPCPPAVATMSSTGPTDPTDPTDPATLTDPVDLDPEVSKLVSDWWKGWSKNDPQQFAPGSTFEQGIEMLSGQAMMPELGPYFNEDFGALAPVWDDF